MRSTDEVLGWRSRKALDRDGDKLGTIEEIYLDAESGNPQWAAVKTGLFGSKLTFVPLEGARPQDDDVVLDWPEHVVKEAPRIDADGQLSPEEEDHLYNHYERYDSPEHHGGAGDDVTAGESARAGTDQGDLDPTAGESARAGTDQRDLDPTAGETARSRAGEDTPAGDVTPDQEGAAVPSGVSAGDTGARPLAGDSSTATAADGESRRPRIKRFIEEELGPDGNPVRRSTRTEETFG